MAGPIRNVHRLLFISRNYPPMTGGLETYSYHLISHFEHRWHASKIVHSKSKFHLLWFLPYGFLKALFLIRREKIRRLHICDALLSPMGCALKVLTGVRVSVTVHGLDITYANRLYQRIVPFCTARLDQVICVSRSTRTACLLRRIPAEKCSVIPNGISREQAGFSRIDGESLGATILGKPVQGAKIVLSVGRLVRRKGLEWFVDQVMPALGESYTFIIVGNGPEFAAIRKAVERRRLEGRVRMLGRVGDSVRNALYRAADVFVMPNISIPDDVEGFGITALEAGINGLPVVASDLQGLRDAVLDGRTGRLVGEKDAEGFVGAIQSIDLDRQRIAATVREVFDWKVVGRRYESLLIGGR